MIKAWMTTQIVNTLILLPRRLRPPPRAHLPIGSDDPPDLTQYNIRKLPALWRSQRRGVFLLQRSIPIASKDFATIHTNPIHAILEQNRPVNLR
jgi:hypothetical protein